jgi:hypothetical protein
MPKLQNQNETFFIYPVSFWQRISAQELKGSFASNQKEK